MSITVARSANRDDELASPAIAPQRSRFSFTPDVRAGILLALVALVVYGSGLRWGLPHATAQQRVDSWSVDDETPLGPLAELHNILEPKPNRNLGYPLMFSFTAAVAYAPYLAYLIVTDRLELGPATYPFGFDDPVTALRVLALIAHTLVTLMAVIVVVAVFDAARVAWGRRTGVLAALFAMTALPMFYYARTGNVDMPMLCFTMLAYASYAHIVMRGHSMRRALALAVFAGLALATKEAALGAFLAIPFVVLMQYRRERPELRFASAAFWKPHVQALLVAFLALGAGSGLFAEPQRYFAHLRFLAGRVNELASPEVPQIAVRTYTYALSDHLAYARALLIDLGSILNLAGLALALAGIVLAFRKREKVALLALPAITYFAWVFLTLRAAQVRYVLPAAILMAGFAAYALLRAWQSRRQWLRYAVAAVGTAALVVQALRGVDLTYQMIKDSRFEAGAWFAQHARPGDRLEFFGAWQSLPPLDASIDTRRAVPFRGMYVPAQVDEAKVQEILAGWRERRPRFVVAIPDHSSLPGVPHSHTFPPTLYAGMLEGRTPFRLVAYFKTPALFPWLPEPRLDYPTVNPPIRVFEAIDAP